MTTTPPVNALEWLANQIRYEADTEKLRNHALMLVMACDNPEQIEDFYNEELQAEGFFDYYKEEDQEYHDGSERFDNPEDLEGWDIAIGFTTDTIRRKLGR